MAKPHIPSFSYNDKLYHYLWNTLYEGECAKHKPSAIVRHYGATLRSFEENLDDFRQEGWSDKRVRAEKAKCFKAERILASAAKQLRRIGY